MYAVWLSVDLLSKPSEGSNIGGGMAVLGAGASVCALALGTFAVVKSGNTGRGAATAGLALVVLAAIILALPTLALLFPDM